MERSERQKNVAKWGAACGPCAAAKAKCLRSNDAPRSKCDRCERLFKDCSSQVHRPRKKRASKPSKTAQLEERLNGLVDLLRASGEISSLNRTDSLTYDAAVFIDQACACLPTDQDPDVSIQHRHSPSEDSESSEGDGHHSGRSLYIPSSYNSFAPLSCICRPGGGPFDMPPLADEELLAVFQHSMSPAFPFVTIPPGTIPAQLEATKPFLFSAIKMATSISNMRSMQGQMYHLLQHISDYMLMRSERSLDLLQGIVVILGWYHHHCLMHSQLNNLLHLAIGLLADLGLNRHPRLAERTKLMVLNPDEPTLRTNEERRVMLGVWYLSSCISVGFQKVESIKFSKYAQQCLKELEESKEYETDLYLINLVRIQHLTERIYEVNSRDDSLDDMSGIPRAPVSAYQAAFQGELDRIQAGMNKSLRNNKFLQSAFNLASLYLQEPPVIDGPLLAHFSNALASVSPMQPSVLDILYRSNNALRKWFEHWLSIPVSLYHSVPMPVCCHLIYSVTMLSRWARLVGPVAPIDSGLGPSQAAASLCTVRASPTGSNTLGEPLPSLGADGLPTPPVPSPAPSPLAPLHLRQDADPGIPAGIAALREQLREQPGLSLDILGILGAVGARLEQADLELREMSLSRGGGAGPSHIWDLSAKKIMITRAKLERWAEIVAAGGAEAVLHGLGREEGGREEEVSGGEEGEEGTESVDTALGDEDAEMTCVPANPEGWCHNLWDGDLFDGLDPNLWFEGTQDWGAIIANGHG